MKFLIISRTKEVFLTLPPERQTELLTAALSWIEKYRKSGKCKEIYWIPGWNRSVVIWEAESGEDASRTTAENPMNPYNDMEAYALSDWDAYIKAMMEARSQR
jgi:muconolactone delta-isomerase